MTKKYYKLVRDRIPEIIEESGKSCIVALLSDEAYMAEYQESKSLEELADLLEVMGAVVKARGYTWDQLVRLCNSKRTKRGGFDKKILLLEVMDAKQVSDKVRPENSGKPWTTEDERQLCSMFDSGATGAELSTYFKRTQRGIAARLVKLGRLNERSELK